MRFNLIHSMLSRAPNNRGPLQWLLLLLALFIVIPLLILILIITPVILIGAMIKNQFFPNTKAKILFTPAGITVYSRVDKTLMNYSWQDIVKVEVWSEENKEFPVLILSHGGPVKLMGVSIQQIKQVCIQNNIPFHEESIIIQDV